MYQRNDMRTKQETLQVKNATLDLIIVCIM